MERILGERVGPFRDRIVIASKLGWNIDPETEARREWLISRPHHVKLAVEDMLRRLRTDRVDLLDQHRVDPIDAATRFAGGDTRDAESRFSPDSFSYDFPRGPAQGLGRAEGRHARPGFAGVADGAEAVDRAHSRYHPVGAHVRGHGCRRCPVHA